tara:strand:- start:68 stop:670 length:603 start_codon:yes stop_codon:yes gene_type:complete
MAINSNVNEFLQRIRQGVKPNMFVVNFEFPGTLAKGGTDVDLTNILCKSAALPASNLGVIEVPFRGRTVKIAGDRTFDTWTATFVNDEDMRIRAFMEEWMGEINSHAGNKSALFTPETSGQGYMAHLLVKQLEKDATDNGSVVREYKLWHCFPTNISQIDLAYDSNDQVSEFTVEFQLSYWTADAGPAAETSPPSIAVDE